MCFEGAPLLHLPRSLLLATGSPLSWEPVELEVAVARSRNFLRLFLNWNPPKNDEGRTAVGLGPYATVPLYPRLLTCQRTCREFAFGPCAPSARPAEPCPARPRGSLTALLLSEPRPIPTPPSPSPGPHWHIARPCRASPRRRRRRSRRCRA